MSSIMKLHDAEDLVSTNSTLKSLILGGPLSCSCISGNP